MKVGRIRRKVKYAMSATSQPMSPRTAAEPMYPRAGVTQSPYMQNGYYNTQNMAQNAADNVGHTVDKAASEVQKKTQTSGVWNLIILLVVLTIVFMVLFWLLKIPIVLDTNVTGALTTNVSFWKLLGTSFVAAIITVFIIWGVSKITSSNKK